MTKTAKEKLEALRDSYLAHMEYDEESPEGFIGDDNLDGFLIDLEEILEVGKEERLKLLDDKNKKRT